MTPEEFRGSLLPGLLEAWDTRCFCASPGFRKLVSFNFQDYGIGPVGLADTEILIDAIIRGKFTQTGAAGERGDNTVREHACPQCGAACTAFFSEFSISMYRSYVTFTGQGSVAPRGLYLVGFYGFRREDFGKIDDFEPAATAGDFLEWLKGDASAA